MVLTNCRVDQVPLGGVAKGDVASHNEHVNILSASLFNEPRLLYSCADRSHNGNRVVVACEIEEVRKPMRMSASVFRRYGEVQNAPAHSECLRHDPNALLSLPISIAIRERLLHAVLDEVDITGDISATPIWCEVVICIIGNLSSVKLVVSNRQKVVGQLLEDGNRIFAIRCRHVSKTSAVVKVTTVNKNQVDTKNVGLRLHFSNEVGEVT